MKKFFGVVGAALLGATMAFSGASAADYPEKTVKIIIPVPPGGGMDFSSRLVAEELQKMWDSPVIVENKPGAGGLVMTKALLSEAADGYTIMYHNGAMPSLNRDPEVDVQTDLLPLPALMSTPYVMFLNSNIPATNLAELKKYSEEHPDELNIAVIGGGNHPLLSQLVLNVTGIKATRVPYQGAGPARAALVGNEVQLYFGTPFGFQDFIKNGQLRAVFSAGEETPTDFPTATPLKAQGINHEEYQFYAFFVKTGTPQPIVDKLTADLSKAIQTSDFQGKIKKAGYDPGPWAPARVATVLDNIIKKSDEMREELGEN